MSPKSRSKKSLARRTPTVQPRICILIVCEGAETEPVYFQELIKKYSLQKTVEVEIIGKECGNVPKSVVNHAIKARKKRADSRSPINMPYEEVWCIMDVEAPKPHTSLDEAVDKARANNLRVALSNPCFEYWYLLHFIKTSALMHTNNQLYKKLKKYIKDYEKANSKTFTLIYPTTDKAIKRAKEIIIEKCYGPDLRRCNPSTHVHLLVEKLKNVSKVSPLKI